MTNLQIVSSTRANLLSNKLNLKVDSEKAESFSPKHLHFYLNYSCFVLNVLTVPSFQRFLCWMLEKENIETQKVQKVQVNAFPLRRANGKGLAGKCNVGKGKIRIYPRTRTFCKVFTKKFDRKTLRVYAANRARAALIHELLHLKYVKDEQKVRELTKDYFFSFTQNQSASGKASELSVYMIFGA